MKDKNLSILILMLDRVRGEKNLIWREASVGEWAQEEREKERERERERESQRDRQRERQRDRGGRERDMRGNKD